MREHEAWDELPDPWEGEHNIEYWVWHEDRLVPATSDELAHIQEEERTNEALFRLEQLRASERQQTRNVVYRVSTLGAWCGSHLRVVVQRLKVRSRHRLSLHTEGARAERSSTR